MRITLQSLRLQNFKGTRDRSVNFGHITNITGDNETGKTTLFDAFTWLLFGKDSYDRKDFNIKTLDKDNKTLHKLEHSVEGVLLVDGKEHNLRRVLREKWTKKKGSPETEFTGHETTYFYMDVPLAEKEYKAKVSNLINEELAKLLTSPLYFNNLKWVERRAILSNMVHANSITDESIAQGNQDWIALLAMLNNKSLAELKKEVSAKKKKIQDELDLIPTRIDEADKGKLEPEDWKAVEADITLLEGHIKSIDQRMEDAVAGQQDEFRRIAGLQQQRHNIDTKLREQKNADYIAWRGSQVEVENKLKELAAKNNSDTGIGNDYLKSIEHYQQLIANANKANEQLRKKFAITNSLEFLLDEKKLECPTCARKLEPGKVKEMTDTMLRNFNANKEKELAEIETTGKDNAANIKNWQAKLDELVGLSKALDIQVADRTLQMQQLYKEKELADAVKMEDSDATKALQKELDAFIVPEPVKQDNTELKGFKAEYQSKLEEAKTKLRKRDHNTNVDIRIKQLSEQEQQLAGQVADLERTEYSIDTFNKAKIEAVEAQVNSQFKIVRFKMFEQQINGGEVECCECLVNGVPFSDVNTAGRVNAGLDIINALNKYYNVSAPVWIDNRESTIRIVECDSQIINLRAVKGAKLTVEVEAKEAAPSLV